MTPDINIHKVQLDSLESKEVVPGFSGRFFHTDEMTIAYWSIRNGSELAEHHHPQRQIVQVREGEFELTVQGVPHRLGPGDVLEIPSNVPHAGRAITDCVIDDIFIPPRPDLK